MAGEIILFGAGDIGKQALQYFGCQNVYCFVDNDMQKAGTEIEGVPVMPFDSLKEIYPNYLVVITVSFYSAAVLAAQLDYNGIHNYVVFELVTGKLGTGKNFRGADNKEIPSYIYNEGYKQNKGYHVHYSQSYYYFSWKKAANYLRLMDRNASILEIGCGSGQFANMLFDLGFMNYTGFDYAAEGVALAKAINADWSDHFFVADAFQTDLMTGRYDLVICFEVLEHIWKDLELLNRICPGTPLLLSVPNFDDTYHVRYFNDWLEVWKRYQKVMRIYDIQVSRLGASGSVLYYIFGEKI